MVKRDNCVRCGSNERVALTCRHWHHLAWDHSITLPCNDIQIIRASMDAQGALVRWVDHSGMYADAMTKRNGDVPLLQMLMRTGRICITEESITLETQIKSLVTKQFIQDSYCPGDASCDGCSVLIVIPGGFSCEIDRCLLMGVRVSV